MHLRPCGRNIAAVTGLRTVHEDAEKTEAQTSMHGTGCNGNVADCDAGSRLPCRTVPLHVECKGLLLIFTQSLQAWI